ncbi:MAG: hypothetical protein RL385_3549 [Pseudomonadota bacterium]|jgi:hypothetical protein
MTQVVTVRTDFADLNQMAQGLVGRVNETHVILPAGNPVDVGEWAQFAVTLQDGTPGFAGVGRCVTYVDNGDERQQHQRFDVVFDSLQFDSRGQQIYTHILALSGYDEGAEGGDPNADPVLSASGAPDGLERADDLAYSDVPGSPEGEDDTSEATVISQRDDLGSAIDTENAPSTADAHTAPLDLRTAPGSAPATFASAQDAAFDPSVSYQVPALSGELFRYAQGLPFPEQPPRPPLSEGQAVKRAPQPAT